MFIPPVKKESIIPEGTVFPYYSKRGVEFYKAFSRNETLKVCTFPDHEEITTQKFDSLESDIAFRQGCEPSNEAEFKNGFYTAIDKLLRKA